MILSVNPGLRSHYWPYRFRRLAPTPTSVFRRNRTPDLSYQQHRSTTQPHGLAMSICAPLGARAYPWILSKYFLSVPPSVCPSVHPSVRPPMRLSVHASVPLQISVGCVYCKTTHLCGILVVFCSYLEYNVITLFSSHVFYRFLHTYFFSWMEVLSMYNLKFVLSPYVCM